MKLGTLDSLLKTLTSKDPAMINKRMALHGYGEVFGLPNFCDYLDVFDKYKFSNCDFSTNGTLITEEAAKKILSKKCLSWVKVSLNSSRKEIHEALNRGSVYERVLDNIRVLVDVKQDLGSRTKIVVQLIKSNLNLDETKEEMWEKLNLPVEILINPLVRYREQTKNPPNVIPCKSGCVGYATHWLFIRSDGSMTGCCGDNGYSMLCGQFDDSFSYDHMIETVDGYKSNPPKLCLTCIKENGNV